MPLHRLCKKIGRGGVHIHRSTVNDLFHRVASLLSPISEQIFAEIREAAVVNADETPLKMQAKEKCRKGYMWVFVAGANIGYEYSLSRSGDTPLDVLGASQTQEAQTKVETKAETKTKAGGFLQVDGYTGYNTVCVPEGRKRMACMAHVRRKFYEALGTAPKEAEQAISLILDIYRIEIEAAENGFYGTDKHLALRQTEGKEKFDAPKVFLGDQKERAPPKSPMGMAISYALGQWSYFEPYFQSAEVRLDNNVSENALRQIALGRKNFLFVGSERAGKNLAVLQTIVATCSANGVNPEEYIKDVLLRLGSTKSSKLRTLLPKNWKPDSAQQEHI